MGKRHVAEDTTAIVGASIIILGGGFVLFKLAQTFGGIFSYNGLSPEEVEAIARKIDESHDIVSRAHGSSGDNQWSRGIYWDKGGTPMYYRYDIYGNGEASYQLYPMVYETWSTIPDFANTTGKINIA